MEKIVQETLNLQNEEDLQYLVSSVQDFEERQHKSGEAESDADEGSEAVCSEDLRFQVSAIFALFFRKIYLFVSPKLSRLVY